MTAINAIRQSKAVHIVSDGIFCNADGIVCELGPNAFALPHLPAALAIRGPTHFMPFLVHRLSRECQSFDDLLARVIPAALEVHLTFPMTLGTLGFGNIEPDFDLIIVGWSTQRRRPESFLVANDRDPQQAHLKTGDWKIIELADVMIAPPVSEMHIRSVNWSIPASAEMFRPEIDGIRLLEAQRLSKGRLDQRNPIYPGVGGFVQLTTVTARGVTSDILHRWPDKLGQQIG